MTSERHRSDWFSIHRAPKHRNTNPIPTARVFYLCRRDGGGSGGKRGPSAVPREPVLRMDANVMQQDAETVFEKWLIVFDMVGLVAEDQI